MPGDINIFDWLFKAAVTFGMAFGGWLWKKNSTILSQSRATAEEALAKASAIEMAFLEHKLDAERRFAKEETMQSSLGRIHDRIDETNTKIDNGFEALNERLFDGLRKP